MSDEHGYGKGSEVDVGGITLQLVEMVKGNTPNAKAGGVKGDDQGELISLFYLELSGGDGVRMSSEVWGIVELGVRALQLHHARQWSRPRIPTVPL